MSDLKVGDIIKIKIEDINFFSYGTAFYNNNKILVAFSKIGEQVEAKITLKKKNNYYAVRNNLIEAEYSCKYFTECGGCNYRHLDYQDYKNLKISHIKKILKNLNIDNKIEINFIDFTDYLRRRAEFKIKYIGAGQLNLGFVDINNNIIDIEECVLLDKKITYIVKKFREFILTFSEAKKLEKFNISLIDNQIEFILHQKAKINNDNKIRLKEFANDLDIKKFVIAYDLNYENLAAEEIIYNYEDIKIKISTGCFLQASDKSQKFICDFIKNIAFSAGNIIDLFSGIGLYGLLLAKENKKVTSYEVDIDMVNSLNNSAKNNNLTANITAYQRDLFKNPLSKELQEADLVIINPPRAGALKQIQKITQLAKKPAVIVIISCNPISFASDAKLLLAGGYKLDNLQILDQFFMSYHMELIASFSRLSN